MLIVGTDAAAVEIGLIGGHLGCPACESVLRPWGHGVRGHVKVLEPPPFSRTVRVWGRDGPQRLGSSGVFIPPAVVAGL